MPVEHLVDPRWFDTLPDLSHRNQPSRFFDPDVFPFFGCRSHELAAEILPAGEPCSNCGAVHDAAGRVLTIPTTPEVAERTGIVAIRTGVHAGDDGLVCGRCLCLSPANRSRVAAGTKPRPRRASRAELLGKPGVVSIGPRLTKAERAGLKADASDADAPRGLAVVVRAFLARQSAAESGDAARADALSALLATAGTARPKAFRQRLNAILRGAADGP